MTRILAVACLLVLAPRGVLSAQSVPDTLSLAALRAAALNSDPRAAQLEILAAQSALRLRNIGAELRPVLSLLGQGQYQSDVASIPVNLPGVSIPMPPHDTYDAHLAAQQRLYDPSTSARRAVERAQTTESQSRVRTALYGITESVNTAFFTALRSQAQIAELETTITDLEAQLSVATERVAVGTALQGERNTLRAEILRRQQTVEEQRALRRAALAILSDLVGRRIDSAASLSLPDLANEAASARTSLDILRNRPEYAQFARSREVLERMEEARGAQDKPRVSAFGRAGYGRPGLNPLSDQFESYWLTGVQLQWTPWNWGATRRDRQISTLQRQILATEEQAFTAAIGRSIEQDLASIDRLQAALIQDEEIIALRVSILSEARTRYAESVITSAEYVDRQTDMLAARLARAIHRVELSQARAHLLTTLGIEVR